jgi:hypothetical protein
MQLMLEALCALLIALPSADQASVPAIPAAPTGQVAPAAKPAPPPFDEQADSRALVAKALAAARTENKRVLIQWGTNADEASVLFAQLAKKDKELARKVLYEYEVALVDVGAMDRNQDLAAEYKADLKAGGIPFVTLLDAGGKVLANQALGTYRADVEGRPGFDTKKIAEFLTAHQAEYLKAAELFDAALVRAKREDKMIFLRFSAPW